MSQRSSTAEIAAKQLTPGYIRHFLRRDALERGKFILRSKRQSPYLFDTGKLSDGESSFIISSVFTRLILTHFGNDGFDLLFGIPYKGHLIAASLATHLYGMHHIQCELVCARKEIKSYGEGGELIGPSLEGKRIIVIDGVLTTGEEMETAIAKVTHYGGIPVGCAVVFDREEKGLFTHNLARIEIGDNHKIPVFSIFTFTDLVQYLQNTSESTFYASMLKSMMEYHRLYGEETRDDTAVS